ncbi:MAG: T9SS type A sorting domain-containing protein [Bacteroidetes bacterium]|nr:T9SS type A sorting domain-containing protein [Bacteroidota bacterium]
MNPIPIVSQPVNETLDEQPTVFLVYPNPASEAIYVVNDGKQVDYSVIIYNSTGTKVREVRNNPSKIPTFGLADGLYQVVIFGNSEVFTNNIVIKH